MFEIQVSLIAALKDNNKSYTVYNSHLDNIITSVDIETANYKAYQPSVKFNIQT